MSEDATLDEFVKKEGKQGKMPIDSVPDSSVASSLDETSVGEIPEGWKATRLADIAKETEYGLTESAKSYDTNKPRYIRTQDFDGFGGLEENSRASLSQEKAKDNLLEKGDILFARSGSVGASLGKTYLYDTDHGECCFGGYSIRHRLQTEGLNHRYLSQYTLSEQYWNWVRRRAKTTAQSNINTSEYGSLLLPIPPLEEQRKIATVLHNVDQAIQKTEEIVTQLDRILIGLVNDLLIKGIDNAEYEQIQIYSFNFEKPTHWEIIELQEINLDSKPICYGVVQPGDHHENGVPLLNIENAKKQREIRNENLHHISTELHERYSRSKLTGGELVISIKGSTGDLGQVPMDIDEWNISRDLARISPEQEIDRNWLKLYLSTNLSQKFIRVNSPGSTRDSLNIGDLKELPVLLPSIEEQKRISRAIQSVESKVNKEMNHIRYLSDIKKALMQDLLSGKVRTTDTSITIPDEIQRYG